MSGISAGETAEFTIAPAIAWPEPVIPQDIEKALEQTPVAKQLWRDITPAARWDWVRWIRSTKSEQTRKRRIDTALKKMLKGERRPCCFNRSQCSVTEVSKSGVIIDANNSF